MSNKMPNKRKKVIEVARDDDKKLAPRTPNKNVLGLRVIATDHNIGSSSKSIIRQKKCNIRRTLLFLTAHDMLDDQYNMPKDLPMKTRETLKLKAKSKVLPMKTKETRKRKAKIEKNLNDDETTFKKQVDVFVTSSTKFISRMNRIQGDRHFLSWKGSIIDSVVGTFMSQNCTDQTSSDAFMELAAKYRNDLHLQACTFKAGVNLTSQWKSKQKTKIKDRKAIKAVRDEFTYLHNQYGYSQAKRNPTLNCLNWEAVRVAENHEVSDAIVHRGMQKKLSARIQGFLNGLVRDIGTLDLEWLKNVPLDDFDKVKTYLMSVEGLGYKSVECVRLLSLLQPAFPVDTNVARVVVRLGWIPLQFLVPLHLVERYPPPDEIYKYLKPLVSELDHKTLYELHYHMITFGKVYCKEKQPDCRSCPMRDECSYIASKKTSSIKEIKKSEVHKHTAIDIEDFCRPNSNDDILLTSLIHASSTTIQKMKHCSQRRREHGREEFYQPDSDNDHVPLISLMPASSTPKRKIKRFSPWRTEHQVYELPDSHPLVATRDKRDPDDHCRYLLAVWNQGHEFVKTKEESLEVITYPATLLIPCRTALRGSFPLNGTHFQPNEVFADSTCGPIEVSCEMLATLKKRTLYCGTSISTVAKGLNETSMESLFCTAFLCTRGFNTETRRSTPLPDIFHKQSKKRVKSRKFD